MCWRCRKDSDTPTRAVPAPYKKHLPFSRQMLSLLLCITSCIECAASCPVPYKQSLFYKLLDCVLDGSLLSVGQSSMTSLLVNLPILL